MLLPHWVDFFDDLQNVRGRSQNTVLAYRRDLELFSEFLEKKKDLSEIYEFMRKHKLSTRSQARMMSSIRTYYKYCQEWVIRFPISLNFALQELRPSFRRR